MTSKYVPPGLRNKNHPPVQKEKTFTPEEFPSFGTAPPSSGGWKNKHSFAVLATDWNAQDEDGRIQQEYRRTMEIRENERRQSEMRHIVRLQRGPSSSAENSEDDDERPPIPSNPDEADGWTVVRHRKVRREYTEEMRRERDMQREADELRESSEYQRQLEDSVWNASGEDGYRPAA